MYGITRVPVDYFYSNLKDAVAQAKRWSCPYQTGQAAGWCALMNWRGERIPRARCGCISL
jgi:hypothetical protein